MATDVGQIALLTAADGPLTADAITLFTSRIASIVEATGYTVRELLGRIELPFTRRVGSETFSIDGLYAETTDRRRSILAKSIKRVTAGPETTLTVIPSERGVRVNNNARMGPMYLGWTQVVVAEDLTDALADEFTAKLSGASAVTVQRHPYMGAAADREYTAWLQAGLPEAVEYAGMRQFPVTFLVPDGVARGLTETTWTIAIAEDTSDVPIASLTGSTADVTDGRWLFLGPLNQVTISSSLSGDFLRWNPQGVPLDLNAGEYLLMDQTVNRAEIFTESTWSFGGGTDVRRWRQFGAGATLRLRPSNGVVPVTITATGKNDDTRAWYRGRQAYAR
jgi:hypothetical protein